MTPATQHAAVIHRGLAMPAISRRKPAGNSPQALLSLADELQVGDCLELDYGPAKSLVTTLRARHDGKGWSLRVLVGTTFGIWRRQ
jgi:hypothetical protein